jgi:hypothetical protein
MGLHGCRMYYPARHPVLQTAAVQLQIKERPSTSAHPREDDVDMDDGYGQAENDNTALPQKPDWVVCKHASAEMWNYGMPEIMPVPTDENYETRGDRDRLSRPIPARDDRCLALELKRPQARYLFSERQRLSFKKLYPAFLPQLPMALHERFVTQIESSPEKVRSVFELIVLEDHMDKLLLNFFPKVHARIVDIFSKDDMEDTILMRDCLMSISKKLPCRNGNVVMFSPALTSLTGSNTAAYFLGMLEQARGALFYLVKYLTKDKTELSASLVVLLDARKHVDQYPSVAENVGTEIRTTQHFLVRVLNCLSGMSEYGAPQAASVAMERPCTWVSHLFTYVFPHEILDWLAQTSESLRTAHTEATGNAHNDEYASVNDDDPDAANEVLMEAITHDGPCGSATVYQVDGRPVPVSRYQHYLLRPRELLMMTLPEFCLCTQIVLRKKQKEGTDEEDIPLTTTHHVNDVPRNVGRPDNLRMRFASADHPLYNTHEVQLRSKINPWILGGDPPPKSPSLPQPDNPTDIWTKTADAFAAYYLVMFRPFSDEDVMSLAFTWDAFAEFIEQIDPVCY